jgi:CRP/FNR family transcriptional regulator
MKNAPAPPRDRAAVLQRFRRRMTAGGTTVIRRGDTGHGLVVVVRGRLEVQADRANGGRVVLAAISPGDYVGETSLLTRSPAMADIVATIDSEIMVLAESEFYEVTGAFPALWIELKAVAERRTREHEQRLRGQPG